MAPRSARKRKGTEGETPGRRRKREDATVVVAAAEAATEAEETKATEPVAEIQGDGGQPFMGDMSLSFEADESQLMEMMGESPSGEQDDSFSMLLETQYEEEEQEAEEHADAGEANQEDVSFSGGEREAEQDMAVDEVVEGSGMEGVEEGAEGEEECGGQANEQQRESLMGASASIEVILQQLTDVASNFMTNFRELTSEGEAIQAELNRLNCEQEERCERMLSRLQRAGNSIFSFGQTQDDAAANVGDES